MKNPFFDKALVKASRLAGKPARVAILVTKLGMKLSEVEWNKVSVSGAKDKFAVFARMASAYASSVYRNISLKSVLILLAAILYFLNPIDLIPDLVPVLGLTDDFGIVLWVYKTLSAEVDKFLAWERSILNVA